MKYLVISDYTSGTTTIVSCPVFNNEDNFDEKVDVWLKEKYPGAEIYWMVCNNLEINI